MPGGNCEWSRPVSGVHCESASVRGKRLRPPASAQGALRSACSAHRSINTALTLAPLSGCQSRLSAHRDLVPDVPIDTVEPLGSNVTFKEKHDAETTSEISPPESRPLLPLRSSR